MELVAVVVPLEDVELASGELWSLGISGVEERPDDRDGFVRLITDADPGDVESLVAGRWATVVVAADPDAWVESWKPWAAPAEIAPGVVVRPPWVASSGADLEVVIDPERAWGHGAHPTTVLCAGWLARRRPAPTTLLDVGCGSGTLSVAAGVFGARRVVAVDIDPEAILATRANATANGVEHIVEVSADPIDEVDGSFEVVVANIGAETLIANASALAARVARPGHLLLSGIFADGVERVTAPFVALGLVVSRLEERDGWALAVLEALSRDR